MHDHRSDRVHGEHGAEGTQYDENAEPFTLQKGLPECARP